MSAIVPTLREFAKSLRPPKLLLLCGSARTGSFNQKLLNAAGRVLAAEGAECEAIDLGALGLPLFDEGLEKEFPTAATDLKASMVAATGMVIACPEYNGSITPLLLNAITWATRGEGPMYSGFQGKLVTIISTSPGSLGGLRMQRSFQLMLQDMGSVVIPSNCSLGGSHKLFDEAGNLQDERAQSKLEAACGQLLHFARFEANRDKDDCIVKLIKEQKLDGEYGAVVVE